MKYFCTISKSLHFSLSVIFLHLDLMLIEEIINYQVKQELRYLKFANYFFCDNDSSSCFFYQTGYKAYGVLTFEIVLLNDRTNIFNSVAR